MCFAKSNALPPLLKLVAFLVTASHKSDLEECCIYGELNNFLLFASLMAPISNYGREEHKSCLWDHKNSRLLVSVKSQVTFYRNGSAASWQMDNETEVSFIANLFIVLINYH